MGPAALLALLVAAASSIRGRSADSLQDPIVAGKAVWLNVPFFVAARRGVSRPLVARLPDPGERVDPAGSRPGSPLQRARPPLRSRLHDHLRDHHHDRGLRLDLQSGAGVVQRRVRRVHLRRHVSRRPGGHDAGSALSAVPRPPPRCRTRSPLQPGRVPVRLYRVLVLHRFLPSTAHVVRESAGGGVLVQGAPGGALGGPGARCSRSCTSSCRFWSSSRARRRATPRRLVWVAAIMLAGALARPLLDDLPGARHRAALRLAGAVVCACSSSRRDSCGSGAELARGADMPVGDPFLREGLEFRL